MQDLSRSVSTAGRTPATANEDTHGEQMLTASEKPIGAPLNCMHSQMRSNFFGSIPFKIASQRARRSINGEPCCAPGAVLASVFIGSSGPASTGAVARTTPTIQPSKQRTIRSLLPRRK
jgi:hypothetical protein